jgi:hypothetical protein
MNDTELIENLNTTLELTIPGNSNSEELLHWLSLHVNQLIQTDFQKLVYLLYRVDVSETKLKDLLEKDPERDAGSIIADLVIERQLQKIKSRKEFHEKSNNISDEEKW